MYTICYRTMLARRASGVIGPNILFYFLASRRMYLTLYVERTIPQTKETTMNINALANDAISWMTNDLNNGLYVLVGIAVLGLLNGIRHSLTHCTHTHRAGRRVL